MHSILSCFFLGQQVAQVDDAVATQLVPTNQLVVIEAAVSSGCVLSLNTCTDSPSLKAVAMMLKCTHRPLFVMCCCNNEFYLLLNSFFYEGAISVAAIQVVQVVRCTRAHDPWGPLARTR